MPTYEQAQKILEGLGYKAFKRISSKRIGVLVDGDRAQHLERVLKEVPGLKYRDDEKAIRVSSIGVLEFQDNGLWIVFKPAKRQGSRSVGIDNELKLINTINDFAKKFGAINVLFYANGKKYFVPSVIKAIEMGRDTTGRKKADVILLDKNNEKYPISIKKANAQYWESADRYYRMKAQNIIDKLIKENKIKILPHQTKKGIFMISPEVAVSATQQEKMDVVFGSDILPNGAVITQTFTNNVFRWNDKTHTLEIACKHIIIKPNEVIGEFDVWFLIRNDSTRKSIPKYPGLRILATMTKRASKALKVRG